MRAKLRRLEEENARKRREIDNLYDTSKVCSFSPHSHGKTSISLCFFKDEDFRRTLAVPSTDRSSNVSGSRARLARNRLIV